MLSFNLKQKLADPDYLKLHLVAVAAIQGIKAYPWYDAHFLQVFESAKRYLRLIRPDALEHFIDCFAPLRIARDFEIQRVTDLFAPDVLQQVRAIVTEISAAQLDGREAQTFGRHIVEDHPYFIQLQQALVPMVSELLRQEVEAGYNFLSLYGNMGKCGLHMDHPFAMYTLDFCIDQSDEWPIHFSDVVDWPTAEMMNNFDPRMILDDPAIPFHAHLLRPNEAILFCGSAQWHYREAMPRPGFCNLLFFHYFPKGCRDIVFIANWPEQFGIPELRPFCDVYLEAYADEAAGT